MGQDWYLLNLDKAQMVPLHKLSETFTQGHVSRRMLAHIPPIKLLPYLKTPPSSPSPHKYTGLDCLPNNVVDEIYRYLEDHVECLRLALTARRYWNLARPQIRRSIAAYLQPWTWAGDRLICIGGSTEPDDLPLALRNDEFAGVNLPELIGDKFTCAPRSIGSCRGYATYRLACTLGDSIDYDANLPRDEFLLKLYRAVVDCVPIIDLEDDDMVLRNLSKREYVRYSALPVELVPKDRWCWCADGLWGLDLGFALHSRICWSTDPNTEMAYTGELHRGVWAGDRFDMVSVRELEREEIKDREVWKDVSKDVAEELRKILASEFCIPPPSEN